LSNKSDEMAQILLMISNRNRPGDGDESAGVRLCDWVKEARSTWSSVPFILFCFQIDLVCDLPKYDGVFLIKDSRELFKIVTTDSMKRKQNPFRTQNNLLFM